MICLQLLKYAYFPGICLVYVTPSSVSRNIKERDKFGREALEKFISDRMVEKTVNFWDPQKKNNLSYFKDIGATVYPKVRGRLVSILHERNLLSLLLVIAKSRPDLVVKDTTGDFEFNAAPPSIFPSRWVNECAFGQITLGILQFSVFLSQKVHSNMTQ